MNVLNAAALAALIALPLGGCVVAPARVGLGAVYVAPGYESPGPGYVWERHPNYGWGWRHPDRGWHRGWQ